MRNFISGIVLGFFIAGTIGATISTPPPLSGEPAQEQAYFSEIYNGINRMDVVTSAPNGTLKGVLGQPVLYNNSGTFTLWVNTDSDTTWQQI